MNNPSAVAGGFVTAGHCGGTGSPTLGFNNVAQGTFAGSSFPGNDYAWVRTNGNWVSQPWVNNYAGGNVIVAGSQEAAIGSSICRSGRTTGDCTSGGTMWFQPVNEILSVYGLSLTTSGGGGGSAVISNWNNDEGARVQLWECAGALNQKWRRG